MEPEELTFQLLREMTKTGVDVAVKIPRHGNNPDLDFKQFQNEFDNLTKVKHINIVQFLGYCYEIEPTSMECDGRIVRAEETHRELCFEYLHNESLQNHLSGMLLLHFQCLAGRKCSCIFAFDCLITLLF